MTFWNCVNLGGPAYISPSSVFLTVLPLFHTGGLNCYTNPVLHAGGTVLIMRAFDPGLALQLISDPSYRINVFFGVPSIYQFMAQHPAFATSDFSRLVIGGVGGAPMPVPLLRVWEQRGVALQQGYGMTETSPAVMTLDREDAGRKAGSSGKPVLHTEVRIVRPDGTDADVGELGELWVRGPNITPGYWNRPDANASSFTEGWLHTGDAARIDEEGFYYIVDRWKDMYISGGENVYPAEVENVLHQLTAIPEMFPNLMTKPNQLRPGPQHHGFPGPLSAADTGIFLDPAGFACGADHPDSASHSQIRLYEARRRPGRRAVSVVRLADWQLFQPSDRGAAGQAGHGGADHRVLRHAVCRASGRIVAGHRPRRECRRCRDSDHDVHLSRDP